MAFNPRTEYDIDRVQISVREFHDYADEYIIRPPYQRKTVWNDKQQENLLDSLFRRYYIPNIVLRLVRLSESETVREVIDGQQRIRTVQRFFANELPLPASLQDFDQELPGKMFKDLRSDIRRYIEKELRYNADIIKGIEDPKQVSHVKVASEIFWRLQQGEKLNALETAHSRLTSTVRNFIVKFADDYDFDFAQYREIDPNDKYKHVFFKEIYGRKNRRMEHLGMLARLLLTEQADGPTDTRDSAITSLIDKTRDDENGIGDSSFENKQSAKSLLRTLTALSEVFEDDTQLDRTKGAVPFRYDFFVVSAYLLLRHITNYYVFDSKEHDLLREFLYEFYRRTRLVRAEAVSDESASRFVQFRQQGRAETLERHQIIRHEFFTYATKHGHKILTKDPRRAFSEAERIAIYLRDRKRCQLCIEEGKPDRECIVPWSQFEADHVLPHSKGGQTLIDNGQVLCRFHNKQKGASYVG